MVVASEWEVKLELECCLAVMNLLLSRGVSTQLCLVQVSHVLCVYSIRYAIFPRTNDFLGRVINSKPCYFKPSERKLLYR